MTPELKGEQEFISWLAVFQQREQSAESLWLEGAWWIQKVGRIPVWPEHGEQEWEECEIKLERWLPAHVGRTLGHMEESCHYAKSHKKQLESFKHEYGHKIWILKV